eukprot:snap_masked-scaffold_14-processed-gene-11.32-mRNA-1 protein AED:1.00 eAED:1.00 QI:0/-1/0/0/-1/1/1/0/505
MGTEQAGVVVGGGHYVGEQPKVETKKKSKASFLPYILSVCAVILLLNGILLLMDDESSEDEETTLVGGVTVEFANQDLSCGLGDLKGRFATKTVYQNRISLADFSDEVEGNSYPTFYDSDTCELKKVYFIARHGTRLPTDGSSEEMQVFNFNNDMDFLDEGLLLPVGIEELYLLGKRFRIRYEYLLGEEISYHPRVFDFNSSAKVRALESAEAFAQGFFESEEDPRPIVAIKSLDEDNDPYLRYHSACALHEFQEDREDAESSFAKIQALGEKYSPILEEHFADVEFGRDGGSVLEYAIVLYNACPYEQAQGCVNENFNENYDESACEMLQNETIIEILEYLADAEDYYYAGLGDQINMDQSCIMRNEIIDFLNGLSNDEIEEMNFRFGFGHSETLLPLIAHFNFSFYQDADDVLENNLFTVEKELFTDEVLNRNYRSSVISPLANNLAFEKYECNGEELLAILHNEIVVFEGTEAEFLEISNFYETECDFEAICEAPEEYEEED